MSRARKGYNVSYFVKVAVVIVGLIAVGLLTWQAYKGLQSDQPKPATSSADQQAPEVSEADDLSEAEDFVADINIDELLSTAEIDSVLE
ncbi:hypothetical protein B7Y94_00430 [Candidatus Saccharibacteria bacterium 32-49-12]|nr:MAG: hypothetical protein B7Y94_00430 [Candidatus Saccharibacteria bacterium 32-49-12]